MSRYTQKPAGPVLSSCWNIQSWETWWSLRNWCGRWRPCCPPTPGPAPPSWPCFFSACLLKWETTWLHRISRTTLSWLSVQTCYTAPGSPAPSPPSTVITRPPSTPCRAVAAGIFLPRDHRRCSPSPPQQGARMCVRWLTLIAARDVQRALAKQETGSGWRYAVLVSRSHSLWTIWSCTV